MPPKRAAPDGATTEEQVKKFRSALDSMADVWVCPITFELPLDPVIAADGRTYERSAIEEHIRVQGDALRSPISNEPMSSALITNPQARSTIEQLVRTGVLGGDKAERWLARLKDEDKLKAMRARAEGGDAAAMWELGCSHMNGLRGLEQDWPAAYGWYRRGADLGDASCLWKAGECLATGLGVEKNVTWGMVLVARGAERGSAGAASTLGDCFDRGMRGLPKDVVQAKAWYKTVASSTVRDLDEEEEEESATHVRELSSGCEGHS